jgi:UMF1 family MFS transporter
LLVAEGRAAVPDDPGSRPARAAWCLYDWANSAFPAVILTFVFAAYFTTAVAADPIAGTRAWGTAVSLSALAIAVFSPVLGAIAHRGGARKPWLAAFTILCVGATFALWWVAPSPDHVILALVLLGIGNFAFELGIVFYNAMLPEIVSHDRIGRLSGWGWGLGYAGGLVCLVVVLFGFVQATPPPFGLDTGAAEHVRMAGPIAAAWFAVFALPLFVWVPDQPRIAHAPIDAVREGLAQLRKTIANVRRYRTATRYLIAHMIYADGLNTLFAFGGVYAAGTFAMKVDEVIAFGIALNLTAGLGAFAFAWIDDRIGAKRTIMIALGALTLIGAAVLVVESKAMFWALGLALGIFFGPAQAASRSLMARLAPADMRAEMFGLFALSGKATAFVGPALLGWVAAAANSQRVGMATVLVFFVVGMVILAPVREPPDPA